MKIIGSIFGLIFLISGLSSCKQNSKPELKEGIWRATLKTASGTLIPFNFEVTDSAGITFLDIINGKERFRVNEISNIADSIVIQMPLFDSEIRVKNNKESLKGHWIKQFGDSTEVMEIEAQRGDSWRFFKANSESLYDISGKWSVSFKDVRNDRLISSIGEFNQNGNRIYATFLTTTGDYRFLEGTVVGDKLYLSCFDGSHAYLFTAKILNNHVLEEGVFYSGLSTVQTWTAHKDEKAELPDAYSLTSLKDGFDKINFSYPDLNGKMVSLSDSKFTNKIILVQFFGSWCPNCMDETAYLVPFYKKYKEKGVEIIALAYERTTDFERSKKSILRLRDRFDVPYDMLITGYKNDKAEVVKSLPMLKNFMGFPTLLVIDRAGKVRKIHTGFSGPGTGIHYQAFKKDFEKTIDSLLLEKN